MIRDVYLYGRLAERFGEGPHRFDAASVTEIGNAFRVQYPGWREAVESGRYRVVAGDSAREVAYQLANDQVGLRLGDTMPEVHIVPVAAGAGDDGTAKIVLGVALAGVGIAASFGAFGAGGPLLGTAVADVAGATITSGNLIFAGAGMVLSGASQMLAADPASLDAGDRESADQNPSFFFSRPVNVTEQGHPVPLVYGRFEVGSLVVSSGITTDQIGLTDPTVDRPPSPTNVSASVSISTDPDGTEVATYTIDFDLPPGEQWYTFQLFKNTDPNTQVRNLQVSKFIAAEAGRTFNADENPPITYELRGKDIANAVFVFTRNVHDNPSEHGDPYNDSAPTGAEITGGPSSQQPGPGGGNWWDRSGVGGGPYSDRSA
jgi:predicted phage tail protein